MKPTTTQPKHKSPLNLRVIDHSPEEILVPRGYFPCFIQGVIKEEIKRHYQDIINTHFNHNQYLSQLNFKGDIATGSSVVISAFLYGLLIHSGMRPAFSSDDQDGKISQLIQHQCSTVFNDIIVSSHKASGPHQEKILENLIHTTEEKVGKIQFPFKVVGLSLDIFPEDAETSGCGLKFVPGPDFKYVHSKRLISPLVSRFNVVDENGIPKFTRKGTRTWSLPQSEKDLLRGLNLSSGLGLYSRCYDIMNSDEIRKVVLVSDAVAQKNIKPSP